VQGFGFVRRQEVVYRDLDRHGHVNNAVYSTWLETARLAYLKEVCDVDPGDELGIVVAELAITFRSPASLGELLEVGVRVPRVGEKSLVFEYELRGPEDRLVAEATTTHVAFDDAQGRSVPVPPAWRRRIERHEPA
jgi:acyl-CoA thioester hydrolase